MSDDNAMEREIPAEEEDAGTDLAAIDRTGHDARLTPPIGAALSVLWWVEGEPVPR